jgi:hypothetical protein
MKHKHYSPLGGLTGLFICTTLGTALLAQTDPQLIRSKFENSVTPPDTAELFDILTDMNQQVIWPETLAVIDRFAEKINDPKQKILGRIELLASNANPYLRLKAMQTLLNLKSPNLLRFMVQGLHDADSRIRRFSIEQLKATPEPEIINQLLHQFFIEKDRDLRHQLLQVVNDMAGYSQANKKILTYYLDEAEIGKNQPSKLAELKFYVADKIKN